MKHLGTLRITFHLFTLLGVAGVASGQFSYRPGFKTTSTGLQSYHAIASGHYGGIPFAQYLMNSATPISNSAAAMHSITLGDPGYSGAWSIGRVMNHGNPLCGGDFFADVRGPVTLDVDGTTESIVVTCRKDILHTNGWACFGHGECLIDFVCDNSQFDSPMLSTVTPFSLAKLTTLQWSISEQLSVTDNLSGSSFGRLRVYSDDNFNGIIDNHEPIVMQGHITESGGANGGVGILPRGSYLFATFYEAESRLKTVGTACPDAGNQRETGRLEDTMIFRLD